MTRLRGARIVMTVTAPRSAAFFAGQLAALVAEGAEPYVITSASRDVEAQCAAEGARFVPLAMTREPSPAGDLRAFAEFVHVLRRIRPTIVNAGTPKAGLLGMVAARLVGVGRRVQTLHGLRFETAHGAARSAIWAAQRLSCAAATHVVCVSSSLRSRAIETGLVTADRAIVLGHGSANGIDDRHFARTTEVEASARGLRAELGTGDARLVGYVGRLARDKGIATLAAAWPRIAQSGAQLVIAGDIDETDPPDVESLTRLRLPQVHFVGHRDPRTVYGALDVLILPSHREGLPTVALEAAAMEVPMVATRATGCVDAVRDGATGTLVRVMDPTALADAVLRYIEQPELRRRHGRAAREFVNENFSRTRVHADIIDFYDRILRECP